MRELFDTFFCHSSSEWKVEGIMVYFAVPYTKKLKLSILVIEKISPILGNSDPQRNATQ